MKTNLDKWYALSVIAGNEDATKKRIIERLKKTGKLTPDLDFICPEQEITVQNNNGQNQRKRKMSVPGYMLVRCRRLDIDKINIIVRVKGVMEFMGGNDNPTTLPLQEVRRLLDDVAVPGQQMTETGKVVFETGDEVEITEGAMGGLKAFISSVDTEKGTAVLDVEIFGQPTKATLDTSQIKRVK